ncbi:MAG TPA: Ig-like domain-containing protein, partial [Thermoanaerobaculia bacterium]|nr:Ig-like domain-containing protein [Thermoanaerobaculia bacterium]
ASGLSMAADYTQTFAIEDSTRASGKGYVTGAVYDASTGRPLAGAIVSEGATDERGRYVRMLDEGVYKIEASAAGFASAWREVTVRAGAGTLPLDFRLTRRAADQIANGAILNLADGGDTAVTRRVELMIPAESLIAGTHVSLTSLGGQALPAPLPLGWSPLAAAEIAVNTTAIPVSINAATLNFVLNAADATAIAAATQSLSLVQYDSGSDEWRVVVAVASIGSDNRVSASILTSGDFALVYPDRAAGLQPPPPARTGAALQGVVDPCVATPDTCRPVSRSFVLDPASIAPNGRTVATLITDGAKPYPSGTAAQATIDEQLNLADGSVAVDPPFTTDLLLYRTPAGDSASAVFHLAPTTRAASVTLRDGVEHIRIDDRPDRVDRGALIGAEGGRISGELVSLEIPKSATSDPIHGAVATITDFSPFGTIAGFHIAGGFNLTLTRGDGSADPVTLLAPPKATLTIPATTAQVIVCEVLQATPFGTVVRIAALTDRAAASPSADVSLLTTKTIDRATLPLDGIVRDGTYLILTADSPIAFAFGQVRLSSGGTTIANALVTSGLGVVDVSRIGGVFVVPVVGKPASPFSLHARSIATGDGAPRTYAIAPDADALVAFGDLILAAQPPHLVSTSPNEGALLDPGSPFLPQATFDAPIDSTSAAGSIVVNNVTTATAVAGSVDAAGPIVTFHPAESLQPATQYSMTVLPQLRGANGAPFGRGVIVRFSTRNLPSANSSIRPDRIHITIPDKQGVSTIGGLAGALPAGAQAIAIRHSLAFLTQYQTTVAADGSFEFAAGGGADAITVTDAIDLQVVDAVSHATIADIPLTPFTTKDGSGFLAPADVDVHFVAPDGTTVNVPAGAFDTPTLISTSPATSAAFGNVPSFADSLTYAAGVNLQFDGTANKRIDIELPVPPNTDPAKPLYLGYLGQSARGPRVMIVDTLRTDNGHLTTKLPGNVSSASIKPASTSNLRPNNILTSAADVKNALLGAISSGTYAAVGFAQETSWAVIDGLTSVDLFWDSMPSMFASSLYLTEGRERVLVPFRAGVKFQVSGVDPATGLQSFTKLYDPLPGGEPVDAIELPSPIENTTGPYPVFTSPARVELLDLGADSLTLTSVRNIEAKLDGGSVTINPSSTPLPANTRVEVLNLNTGDLQAAADFRDSATVRMRASVGDRLLIIIGEQHADASDAVSVVFNEAIFINGDADGYLQSERLIKVLSRDLSTPGEEFADITKQVKFEADSGNRRIILHFQNPLQLGKQYRLVISRNIGDKAGFGGTTDLRLAQRRINGTVGPQLSDDLHIDFATREPGGKIASFNLQQGAVRDLALAGNIALVSALDGGVQAYDVSDPATLDASNNPRPFATVPAGATEFWGIAADRHGRVFTTGLTSTFGVLRSYRLADFIAARDGVVNRQVASTTLSWRPGINVDVPVGTEVGLSDRPEATPRKIQIVLQDVGDDDPLTADMLVRTFAGTSSDAGGGFQQLTINVRGDRTSEYQVQTVTVENRTLDLRWSVDVARNDTATIRGILARPQDKLFVIRNRRTYAVVSLFGYGVSVFDLNAVESNDYQPAEENYKPLQEEVATSTGADPTTPAVPCDPQQSAQTGAVCPIRDLSLSPDALIQGGDALNVFALDANRGVLDLSLVPPSTTLKPAGGGVVFATSFIDQPRLRTLRDLYRNASGRQPFPHFTSIAAYKTYALVAANQFGLLVIDLSSGALGWDSLRDVVWIPAGAYSVRVMPDSDLAVVVDGAGRALLIDLTKIDQSSKVQPLPVCGNASCAGELYPSAK